MHLHNTSREPDLPLSRYQLRSVYGMGPVQFSCDYSLHVGQFNQRNPSLSPAAQNFEERERWVHALDSCIKRLHQPIRVREREGDLCVCMRV